MLDVNFFDELRIGLATAERFAREGWTVGIYDYDDKALAAVKKDHPEFITGHLVVRKADEWTKALADFKAGKRKSDTMKPQAEELTPAEMKALGAFFEGKKVGPRPAKDAELLAVGKYTFERGNQFTGLPSCASCHGPKGLGTPQLPRLAGQHPRYIEDQLKRFNSRERNNDNAVMHTVASKLSELERHAVAEYIATLN